MSVRSRLALAGLLSAAFGLAGYVLIANCGWLNQSTAEASKIHTAAIEVGPFDIHRKYRSMEGPYVIENLRISDILASQKIVVPETSIKFVELNRQAAPSMGGKRVSSGGGAAGSAKPDKDQIIALKDLNARKRELYWFKGIKLQVLDENDRPLPTAEFLCHLNVDVDVKVRHAAFAQAEPNTERLITLSQGQAEFHLPDGYAVPVASDEQWHFYFQAANRTTMEHRRIKHLCTLEFEKDAELRKPIKPLCWFNPFVTVVLDKDNQASAAEHGATCMVVPTRGANAPNMVNHADFKNWQGVNVTGHYVVPPGLHTYQSEVNEKTDPGLTSENRIIRAVWSHVHPLCTESSLVACTPEGKKPVFTVHVETKTDGGIQTARIDNIISREGIALDSRQRYELSATYNNTTGHDEDSMVVEGIFCDDNKWVKPMWDHAIAQGASGDVTLVSGGNQCKTRGVDCGVKPALTNTQQQRSDSQTAPYYGVDQLPLYNPAKDGPILRQPKPVVLNTSAGPIRIVLDPGLAPQTASQMYKLLKGGVFNKTGFYRYEKDFVLQLTNAQEKVDHSSLPDNLQSQLRRLPLEISLSKEGYHRKWALSMGRYEPVDSGVTSFSILLGAAPHLDRGYTIFGHMSADQQSVATINKIVSTWNSQKQHPYLFGVADCALPKRRSID